MCPSTSLGCRSRCERESRIADLRPLTLSSTFQTNTKKRHRTSRFRSTLQGTRLFFLLCSVGGRLLLYHLKKKLGKVASSFSARGHTWRIDRNIRIEYEKICVQTGYSCPTSYKNRFSIPTHFAASLLILHDPVELVQNCDCTTWRTVFFPPQRKRVSSSAVLKTALLPVLSNFR